jgi:FkbH-like protein
MNVKDALQILATRRKHAPPFRVLLGCGFTPLHLTTLLAARVQQAAPERNASVAVGLFGDLVGTLRRAVEDSPDAACVLIEWADLDPRLGFREARRWGPRVQGDVLLSAQQKISALLSGIRALAAKCKVALVAPTLPLSPLFPTTSAHASRERLALECDVAAFLQEAAAIDGVLVLDSAWLRSNGATPTLYDPVSDLRTGFPYTVPHADRLAEGLARLLAPVPPKKGLISDLDNTLWSGIIGEIGSDAVAWDLASQAHHHALYQVLLASLADEGVLVAVASKNSASVAAEGLARRDLLLDADKLFPKEIHWEPKSRSVERILAAWNIGADSVVFVDDSEHELAEVRAAFPQVQCIQFPANDPAAAVDCVVRLRDVFAKQRASAEDALRLASLKDAAVFKQGLESAADADNFLATVGGKVTIDWLRGFVDPRALELINKTNQFNVNGARLTDADWRKSANARGAWSMVVSYEDRFGSLGKIAVLAGAVSDDQRVIIVDTWVMSCRAFSRKIEHQCLMQLLVRYPHAQHIEVKYAATARNDLVREFLASLGAAKVTAATQLDRHSLEQALQGLSHQVVAEESNDVRIAG